MHPKDFCYWLQGMFELSDPKLLDAKQTDLIKRHLALVFYHSIDKEAPNEMQDILNKIHDGKLDAKDLKGPIYALHNGDFTARC